MRLLPKGIATVLASTWLAAVFTAAAMSRSGTPADAPAGRVNPLAGLDCGPPRANVRSCVTSNYDVTGALDVCEEGSASFGAAMGDAPVVAHDRLTEGAQPVATFGSGQFVCIQLYASPVAPDDDGWLYVVAIPPALVRACGSTDCGRSVATTRWLARPRGRCAVIGSHYTDACPAGWVPRARIDQYSMGLHGEYAEPAP